MEKYLVTGADGFIGSHLVEKLVRSGKDVRAMVHYNSFGSNGWLDNIDKKIFDSIEIISGDIRDAELMKDIASDCTNIIHLAAMMSIPYSYKAPRTFIETNVMGTLNILMAAKDLNIQKTIITSTSEVYGSAKYVPMSEDHRLNAQSPYAASKTAADQLSLSFYHSFSLPITIIRPFNTYGPRQSTRAVIPTIITQIKESRNLIKLGSTHTTRDFSYVEDTVNGLILASKVGVAEGEILNLGNNFEISIGETANLISDLMGFQTSINIEELRKRPDESEVDRLWSDNSRSKMLLGWEPKYSGKGGFINGLKKTIEWFDDPLNLSFYRFGNYSI
tara:strand:- start:1641 stop:2639 length:999 start_codon:yes stop_codon:yes gene_type:complete